MFEDSPESFISRWRPFATRVHVFPRTEGSPLLEIRVGETVLQVLERTGPYLAAPGPWRMILNPMADRIERVPDGEDAPRRTLAASGISRLEATGVVLERDRQMLVVDAGAPLVVGVLEDLGDEVAAGDAVTFEAQAPVHGFVLPTPVRRGAPVSTDDMV